MLQALMMLLLLQELRHKNVKKIICLRYWTLAFVSLSMMMHSFKQINQCHFLEYKVSEMPVIFVSSICILLGLKV
jgi:uncharacterized protein with PQ loop repeat